MQEKLAARFWSKVDLLGDCWVWCGATDGSGYGHLKDEGRMAKAHRLSYESIVAAIPPGTQLDHLCRNRACVYPLHLDPVTSRENTYRGNGPAGLNARKSRCKRGHPLTGENVALVDTGRGRTGRRCLTCRTTRRVA